MSAVERAVDDLFDRPAELGVSLALVAMVDGEVVAERYGTRPANAFEDAAAIDADTRLTSWSMAKSMTHAAIGILVGDGLIDLDAPAPIPEWDGTAKADIRIIDLLEMRPGLRFIEDYVDGETSHCIAMLFGEGADDHAAYAAALPLDHEPGTVWNYSSGTTNILSRIIGDVVTTADDPDGRRAEYGDWLRQRLFDPIGMASADPRFDEVGNWVGSSYTYATARDFARFGEFYRHDGVTAAGERLLPEGWADHARTFVAHDADSDEHAELVPGGFDYGRHWWMWRRYPGSVVAQGYEGQAIAVVPDRNLTLVHLGKTPVDVRQHLTAGLFAIVDAATS